MSHKGYLSRIAKWNWLHKDYVLSMLSPDKDERLKRYCQFVSKEDEEEINAVFEKKRGPSNLGSEGLVNLIKEKFHLRKVDDEVPRSRESAPVSDRIKKAVCEHYRIDKGELLRSRRGLFNEPGNVAIYLTRRMRGDSLQQIGDLLNNVLFLPCRRKIA